MQATSKSVVWQTAIVGFAKNENEVVIPMPDADTAQPKSETKKEDSSLLGKALNQEVKELVVSSQGKYRSIREFARIAVQEKIVRDKGMK